MFPHLFADPYGPPKPDKLRPGKRPSPILNPLSANWLFEINVRKPWDRPPFHYRRREPPGKTDRYLPRAGDTPAPPFRLAANIPCLMLLGSLRRQGPHARPGPVKSRKWRVFRSSIRELDGTGTSPGEFPCGQGSLNGRERFRAFQLASGQLAPADSPVLRPNAPSALLEISKSILDDGLSLRTPCREIDFQSMAFVRPDGRSLVIRRLDR